MIKLICISERSPLLLILSISDSGSSRFTFHVRIENRGKISQFIIEGAVIRMVLMRLLLLVKFARVSGCHQRFSCSIREIHDIFES